MVANYFFEMNLIIAELARILKKGGKIIMVNDNVRYNGDEIQYILSFRIRCKIRIKNRLYWILERGKGIVVNKLDSTKAGIRNAFMFGQNKYYEYYTDNLRKIKSLFNSYLPSEKD
jgi:hypothetical protein